METSREMFDTQEKIKYNFNSQSDRLLGAVLEKDNLDVCPPYIADALTYLKGKLE
jgi:hypothetical protein